MRSHSEALSPAHHRRRGSTCPPPEKKREKLLFFGQAWFCSNSMIMNPDKSNSISLPPLSALTHYLIRSLSISLAFQSHSATRLKYLVLCLILVSLFLNTPRPSQNLTIIFGPSNKLVVHLMTQLSALLPLLLSLPDSITLTPFYSLMTIGFEMKKP